MKKKYVIHPGDYAIGENEKLYGDMAAKGWLLEKRGSFLSRFRKSEPEQLRYRIELASPNTLNGETELPDEQLALYEECGWSFVTGRVWIHIFSAPEGSDAPEFYNDPKQQAVTLKGLRRRYYFGWTPLVVTLIVNIYMRVIITGNVGTAIGKFAGAFKIGWITHTAFLLFCAFAVLWSAYATLYGAVCTARLYRRLKRGLLIDHAPKGRRLLHRIVSGIMCFCCTASIVLTAAQYMQNKKYDMPTVSDGPYLLLGDLGWDGERDNIFSTDKASSVETKHSMLADQWHTYECVTAGSGHCWMYQDIYVLRDKRLTRNIVPLLMADSTFTPDISGFKHVDVNGLDEAYKSHMEYIAVKGTTVYFITYSEPNNNPEQGTQVDVLEVLAELYR
jgi:hypothetical protein